MDAYDRLNYGEEDTRQFEREHWEQVEWDEELERREAAQARLSAGNEPGLGVPL